MCRRRALALAVVALLVALAGCDGTGCAPGATEIGEVSAAVNESVAVGGTIVEFDPARIVLEDGTGQALLVSLEGYDTSAAGVGDCVDAEGEVVESGAGSEYDVVIRTSAVQLRDG